MIDKPWNEIGKDDLEQLVTDGVPESRTIDYKRELPAKGEQGKNAFLADVSAFANAGGGIIVFGVVESEGMPQSIPGLAGIDPDKEIQRLENLHHNGLDPRIRGVQIKAIAGFENGPVILVRIPRSRTGPHMITGSPRFYSRNSNGNTALNATEIRAAFLHSQGLADRVRQFRDDRIGRIVAGETPVPLSESALIVLHFIPMSLWATGDQIDISPFIDGEYLPSIATGGSGRPNLDGFLMFSQGRNERKASGYSQLFRNGAIEAVHGLGLSRFEDEPPHIGSGWLEQRIIQTLESFVQLFLKLQIEGEFVVFLSLLGVRDCYLYTDSGQRAGETSEQDIMLFPELILADANVRVSAVARPLIDHLWQAFGFPASPNYAGGGWIYENRRS